MLAQLVFTSIGLQRLIPLSKPKKIVEKLRLNRMIKENQNIKVVFLTLRNDITFETPVEIRLISKSCSKSSSLWPEIPGFDPEIFKTESQRAIEFLWSEKSKNATRIKQFDRNVYFVVVRL